MNPIAETTSMARTILITLLVFSTILLSGCSNKVKNNTTTQITRDVSVSEENTEENVENEWEQDEPSSDVNEEVSNDSAVEVSESAANIIGKWASHEIGEINGQSSSDDELITFMDNGTFTDVIVTSGPLMKGTLREEGKFKVSGNKIVFYDCTESWTPDPGTSSKKLVYKDKSIEDFEYEYELIDSESISISMRTYERVK